MKIIKVFGGLGNQMFQYAFYEYIKQWDENTKLDISDFKLHKYHNGFELDEVFKLTFDSASDDEVKSLSYDQKKVFFRLMRKMGLAVYKQSQFEEGFHNITIGEGRLKRNIYFAGNWQSSFYPAYIENKLRTSFVFRNDLNEKNKEALHDIETSNSVSVHIRMGDYLNNASMGGICSESYYESAVNYIQDRVSSPRFYVFSDDLNWVKDNLPVPSASVFVDWNTGADSSIDMRLMAACKHNIIANSSFSWWGAWLNEHDDKIVIMPQKWYNNQDANPLICDGWITL